MKIPKIRNLGNKAVDEVRIVKIENFGTASFYDTELSDPKAFVKFVKRIERIVRSSIEYKRYVGYLKNELDMKQCTFLPQVNLDEIKGVGLEFHHYPLTLFDMVTVILNHMIAEKGNSYVSPFHVADEVMKSHYENLVGLVPLTKTVHELAHSGEIFISLDQVYGNVRGFLQKYPYGVSEDIKDQLRNLINLTEQTKGQYEPTVLNKSIMKIETDEFERIKKIVKEQRELA